MAQNTIYKNVIKYSLLRWDFFIMKGSITLIPLSCTAKYAIPHCLLMKKWIRCLLFLKMIYLSRKLGKRKHLCSWSLCLLYVIVLLHVLLSNLIQDLFPFNHMNVCWYHYSSKNTIHISLYICYITWAMYM